MFKNIHIGMPQGSVLSLALFIFFMSDCHHMLGLKVMFADDLSDAASALSLKSIKTDLNADMIMIAAWAKRKHLNISPKKSHVTFSRLTGRKAMCILKSSSRPPFSLHSVTLGI
jgi:hypothetical protein